MGGVSRLLKIFIWVQPKNSVLGGKAELLISNECLISLILVTNPISHVAGNKSTNSQHATNQEIPTTAGSWMMG